MTPSMILIAKSYYEYLHFCLKRFYISLMINLYYLSYYHHLDIHIILGRLSVLYLIIDFVQGTSIITDYSKWFR